MSQSPDKNSIGLVGAGYISGVHAEALRSLGRGITAIVDPNRKAAERLARRWNVPNVFGSVDEAIAAKAFARAHVLVPPDLHHTLSLPLLRAGISVFTEKPMATSLGSIDAMIAAAAPGAQLGVNQNFVYHPAFARMRVALDRFELGRPNFVDVIYHAPLRQLAARQFSHWMFREPGNILLEQAVHPLSQLVALCGNVGDITAQAGPSVEIAPGTQFFPTFTATMHGSKLPASMRFAVGAAFPFWQVLVTCDDGVMIADIFANRFWTIGRTRWLDAVDAAMSGRRSASAMAREGWKTMRDYSLSIIKLKPRSDAFFQSMQGSIGAFHDALDRGVTPPLDGAFGRTIVDICKRVEAQIMPAAGPAKAAPAASTKQADVAVLGGTGFIGASVVARLRKAGLTVSVMARNLGNLSSVFSGENVILHRGDIRNADDVARAIAGAKYVVNLAHGGGGETYEEIRDAMVGGAEIVAKACLAAGVKRLIHVGSIASLYLGPQSKPITGATPPDPQAEQRSHYARAKAVADVRLMEMHAQDKLPLCILRPGLVVGAGTSPFHSGLGFFNNDQHCIGWNEGKNPLPWVLVDDVAEAIFQSLEAPEAVGRAYNLVGDVRPSARDYIAELGRHWNRPLTFHPKNPRGLYLDELNKWVLKRVGGRKVPMPSLRDILSRGLKAHFDCSDAMRDLNWHPVADHDEFVRQAILVHTNAP